jgi:uncharacterized protein (TIGR02453 family)
MFSRAAFDFLRELRDHNDRSWFAANKERYEKVVRNPALQFIGDFGARLAKISPHLVADPRPVGGSMFRIYRDTRFSRDKSPYKTHIGIHFFHESAKKAPSVPGFYLHVQPGESFAAAGIWHPDPAALEKLRRSIADDSAEWRALRKSKLTIEGGSLKRPPRGFPSDHRYVDDLKRIDFVTSIRLSDKQLCDAKFVNEFAKACRAMSPVVRFTAQALRLPY